MIGNFISRAVNKFKRARNQRHAYDFPEQSGGWRKHSANPILGDKSTGSMFDPYVREYDGEFLMCVSERKNHSLMIYRSENGVDFKDGQVILRGVKNSDFEQRVNRGCLLKVSGKWLLWYTGQCGNQSKIGFAQSSDGINFSRHTSPVLVPELPFEKGAVMNPCVMWDEDRKVFRMWYAAGENYEPDVICYAESADGIEWNKNTAPVLTPDKSLKYRRSKVGACDVIKLPNGKYCMAYIAYQNVNVARICLAYSENGENNWTDDRNNPILSPAKNQWDGHSVYKPTLCVDKKRKKLLLWYNGRVDHNERIGLAELDI